MDEPVIDARPAAGATATGELGAGFGHLDPVTGLLARAPFVRLTSGVRHEPGAGFGIVRARFRPEHVAAIGTVVRSVLAPGDVAARWGPYDVVVLRHPLTRASSLTGLTAALRLAVEELGGRVEALVSTTDGETPPSLLGASA